MKTRGNEVLLLFMVFLHRSARGVASVVDRDIISGKLDGIFFMRNLTEVESKSIHANARETYAILRDFQAREIHGLHLTNRVKAFTWRIIRDVEEGNLNVMEIFENMRSYLKDDGNQCIPETEAEALKPIVGNVLEAINRKLGDCHAESGCVRQDAERILSMGDISVDEIWRKGHGIDGPSVAFFFLELFATLLGLSWGIISMAIGKPTSTEHFNAGTVSP